MQNINIDPNLITILLITVSIAIVVSVVAILIHRKYVPDRTRAVNLLNDKKFIKRLLATILIVFFAWLVVDLSGVGGNVRFYTKWAECRQKPVVSGSLWESKVSHYVSPPTFKLIRLSPEQFCTPREAELKGYSANPYSYTFEHTTREEGREYYLKHRQTE